MATDPNVPRQIADRFLFLVTWDGLSFAGFNSVSGLRAEHDVIEYNEGGRSTPFVSPGLLKFPPVTLERGASLDDEMYEWFQITSNIQQGASSGIVGVGAVEDTFRRNVDVIQLSRDKAPLKTWRLFRAWPAAFEAGEWDADASEKTIEKMDLRHEGLILRPPAT